jgi:hypothetical protein
MKYVQQAMEYWKAYPGSELHTLAAQVDEAEQFCTEVADRRSEIAQMNNELGSVTWQSDPTAVAADKTRYEGILLVLKKCDIEQRLRDEQRTAALGRYQNAVALLQKTLESDSVLGSLQMHPLNGTTAYTADTMARNAATRQRLLGSKPKKRSSKGEEVAA